MAKKPTKPKKNLVAAVDVDAVTLIRVDYRDVEGVRTAFVTAWPKLTVVADEALKGLSDIAALDGDVLTIKVGNGLATYQKVATGVDAKEGETVFKLVEGVLDDEPADADDEDDEEDAEDKELVLNTDTSGDYERRERLSDVVDAAAKASVREGDAARHAGLHRLSVAFGEFKRACAEGAQFFPEDSAERGALTHIPDEL